MAQGVFQRYSTADGSPRLRLNMVGLLATQQKAFFCLPKIGIDQPVDVQTSVRNSFAAIHAYHRHVRRGPEASRSGEADVFLSGGSILDHFLRLWEWTRDFGLHQDEVAIRDDDYRAIDWRTTISSTLPVHQLKSIIYPEPKGERFSKTLSSLGIIQAFALISMQDKLGPICELWSEKHDEIWQSCHDAIVTSRLYLNDRSVIDGILNEYEVTCTRDIDKELLELMKLFYAELYRKSASPTLYGISSFHVVWEHMCATLVQGAGEAVSHSTLASQPVYRFQGAQLKLEPQRPDILRRMNGGIIIGDAKWYKVDVGELPGTPDAIKQFSYGSTIIEDETIIGNFLFLPTLTNAPWVHLGRLTMQTDQGTDTRFPDILLIGLGWDNAVALYSRTGQFPSEFYNWLVQIGCEN